MSLPSPATDRRWMLRALELARRGLGRTAPDPVAGALVVEKGQVVGESWHQQTGTPHRLDAALTGLADRAAATVYLTFEPSNAPDRPGPRPSQLVATGARRVVVAQLDPTPARHGQGVAALRAAGITVEVGTAAAEARHCNAPFVVAQALGRPFVALKAASTLDGHVADASGRSKWITGPDARQAGHRLRNTHDTILVGSGTLLADDPSLNCRLPGGRDPVPVLLDSRLRCPADARVLTAGARPLLFCAEGVNLRSLPAEVLPVPRGKEGLDLNAVMEAILARGHTSVLVEGGPRVHHALISAGMADRIHLFVNARVLSGGTRWVEGPAFSLSDAPGYRFHSSAPVGDDLHVVLTPLGGPLAPAPE